jgi:hypothetical protein
MCRARGTFKGEGEAQGEGGKGRQGGREGSRRKGGRAKRQTSS